MNLFATASEMLIALTMAFNSLPTTYFNMSDIVLMDTPHEIVEPEEYLEEARTLGEYHGKNHCEKDDKHCKSRIVIYALYRYAFDYRGEIFERRSLSLATSYVILHEVGHAVGIELHPEDQKFFMWGEKTHENFPTLDSPLSHVVSDEKEAFAEAFSVYWAGVCDTKTQFLSVTEKRRIKIFIRLHFIKKKYKDSKGIHEIYNKLQGQIEANKHIYETKCLMIEEFGNRDLEFDEVIELRKRQRRRSGII